MNKKKSGKILDGQVWDGMPNMPIKSMTLLENIEHNNAIHADPQHVADLSGNSDGYHR